MKKILSILLFTLLLFGSFNYAVASNQSKVTAIMNNFYSKLDKSISNVGERIEKLEIVNNKIELLKRNKWDKLSNNSKDLLYLIELNINNKILFYENQLENNEGEVYILKGYYANNKLINKKSGDSILIGTFSIGSNTKYERTILELKIINNGFDVDNISVIENNARQIFGKNTGTPGIMKFSGVKTATIYSVYGNLGDELSGNFSIELYGLEGKRVEIKEKRIGSLALSNEKLKPELTIRDSGGDYFRVGNYQSTTFSLGLDTINHKFTEDAYIDSITIQVYDLVSNGSVSIENLKTGEKYTIGSIPSDGLIKIDMKGTLFKSRDKFQMTATAKGRFIIPKEGLIYHTNDNSVYTNKYWKQLGQNY